MGRCEECGLPLWQAGEVVPAGMYQRMDDAGETHPVVILDRAGPLRASLDGHIALYHAVAATYTCHTCGHHASPPVSVGVERTEAEDRIP